VVKVSVEIPKEDIKRGLSAFRRGNTKCIENTQGLCRELVEYYEKLRDELIEKDPENINKTIIQRHYTTWCPHCIDSAPVWASILNEYLNGETNSRFIFLDNNEQENRTPGIRSIPTIVRFDGEKISMTQAKDYARLKKFIDGG
jgi:thiol-disulfide isomerase/thioredoxin